MSCVSRIIDVKESLWKDNEERAARLRNSLRSRRVLMVDLMGSPGSGKTSLLLETLRRLPASLRAAVVEGDLDSTVDAEAVEKAGWTAVQVRTGGFCHLDAAMVGSALETLGFGSGGMGTGEPPFDLVFVENIGNLVCTAQSDVGASLRVAHLSRPEGDDKPLKYPVMFRTSDILVLTKADYDEVLTAGGPAAPFDAGAVRERCRFLNPALRIFETSCRTGTGLDEWAACLIDETRGYRRSP
ncbi:MAG: hydrogenase accessory protein HypB [Treponema sp. GWB1_62_6]|nr:MAG: hydrogenase accessory protein HypB [Treponema sp. GWB1_62_6]OHE68657.1 MAG: hydrogenase accessory protein HypB [Treponema sp. GWC1_61_84]OHE70365.1 MAG: hydrogenase accessory protein HypB [Treponema sp. RIFOXYC1_FULL_61_9]